MGIKNYIEQLQKQPYETRVRTLWTATFVIGAVVVVVWGGLTVWGPKFRNKDSTSFFGNLREQYEKAKGQFGNASTTDATTEKNYQPVTVTSVELYREAEVLIRFSVANTSEELLSFLAAEGSNLTLVGNNTSTAPNVIVTDAGVRFPNKILSHLSVNGSILFPKTGTEFGKLVISNMSYEGQDTAPFTQEIQLETTATSESNLLPRQ